MAEIRWQTLFSNCFNIENFFLRKKVQITITNKAKFWTHCNNWWPISASPNNCSYWDNKSYLHTSKFAYSTSYNFTGFLPSETLFEEKNDFLFETNKFILEVDAEVEFPWETVAQPVKITRLRKALDFLLVNFSIVIYPHGPWDIYKILHTYSYFFNT